MVIVYIITALIVGGFIGVLFGRKNKAIADKLASEANEAKAKAEAELASLKTKVTTASK